MSLPVAILAAAGAGILALWISLVLFGRGVSAWLRRKNPMRILAMIMFGLFVGGCVAGKHGDTIYGSFLKDIDAKGTIEVRPDGTKVYHIDVTSNTSAKMFEAGLTAMGNVAAKAVKP